MESGKDAKPQYISLEKFFNSHTLLPSVADQTQLTTNKQLNNIKPTIKNISKLETYRDDLIKRYTNAIEKDVIHKTLLDEMQKRFRREKSYFDLNTIREIISVAKDTSGKLDGFQTELGQYKNFSNAFVAGIAKSAGGRKIRDKGESIHNRLLNLSTDNDGINRMSDTLNSFKLYNIIIELKSSLENHFDIAIKKLDLLKSIIETPPNEGRDNQVIKWNELAELYNKIISEYNDVKFDKFTLNNADEFMSSTGKPLTILYHTIKEFENEIILPKKNNYDNKLKEIEGLSKSILLDFNTTESKEAKYSNAGFRKNIEILIDDIEKFQSDYGKKEIIDLNDIKIINDLEKRINDIGAKLENDRFYSYIRKNDETIKDKNDNELSEQERALLPFAINRAIRELGGWKKAREIDNLEKYFNPTKSESTTHQNLSPDTPDTPPRSPSLSISPADASLSPETTEQVGIEKGKGKEKAEEESVIILPVTIGKLPEITLLHKTDEQTGNSEPEKNIIPPPSVSSEHEPPTSSSSAVAAAHPMPSRPPSPSAHTQPVKINDQEKTADPSIRSTLSSSDARLKNDPSKKTQEIHLSGKTEKEGRPLSSATKKLIKYNKKLGEREDPVGEGKKKVVEDAIAIQNYPDKYYRLLEHIIYYQERIDAHQGKTNKNKDSRLRNILNNLQVEYLQETNKTLEQYHDKFTPISNLENPGIVTTEYLEQIQNNLSNLENLIIETQRRKNSENPEIVLLLMHEKKRYNALYNTVSDHIGQNLEEIDPSTKKTLWNNIKSYTLLCIGLSENYEEYNPKINYCNNPALHHLNNIKIKNAASNLENKYKTPEEHVEEKKKGPAQKPDDDLTVSLTAPPDHVSLVPKRPSAQAPVNSSSAEAKGVSHNELDKTEPASSTVSQESTVGTGAPLGKPKRPVRRPTSYEIMPSDAEPPKIDIPSQSLPTPRRPRPTLIRRETKKETNAINHWMQEASKTLEEMEAIKNDPLIAKYMEHKTNQSRLLSETVENLHNILKQKTPSKNPKKAIERLLTNRHISDVDRAVESELEWFHNNHQNLSRIVTRYNEQINRIPNILAGITNNKGSSSLDETNSEIIRNLGKFTQSSDRSDDAKNAIEDAEKTLRIYERAPSDTSGSQKQIYDENIASEVISIIIDKYTLYTHEASVSNNASVINSSKELIEQLQKNPRSKDESTASELNEISRFIHSTEISDDNKARALKPLSGQSIGSDDLINKSHQVYLDIVIFDCNRLLDDISAYAVEKHLKENISQLHELLSDKQESRIYAIHDLLSEAKGNIFALKNDNDYKEMSALKRLLNPNSINIDDQSLDMAGKEINDLAKFLAKNKYINHDDNIQLKNQLNATYYIILNLNNDNKPIGNELDNAFNILNSLSTRVENSSFKSVINDERIHRILTGNIATSSPRALFPSEPPSESSAATLSTTLPASHAPIPKPIPRGELSPRRRQFVDPPKFTVDKRPILDPTLRQNEESNLVKQPVSISIPIPQYRPGDDTAPPSITEKKIASATSSNLQSEYESLLKRVREIDNKINNLQNGIQNLIPTLNPEKNEEKNIIKNLNKFNDRINNDYNTICTVAGRLKKGLAENNKDQQDYNRLNEYEKKLDRDINIFKKLTAGIETTLKTIPSAAIPPSTEPISSSSAAASPSPTSPLSSGPALDASGSAPGTAASSAPAVPPRDAEPVAPPAPPPRNAPPASTNPAAATGTSPSAQAEEEQRFRTAEEKVKRRAAEEEVLPPASLKPAEDEKETDESDLSVLSPQDTLRNIPWEPIFEDKKSDRDSETEALVSDHPEASKLSGYISFLSDKTSELISHASDYTSKASNGMLSRINESYDYAKKCVPELKMPSIQEQLTSKLHSLGTLISKATSLFSRDRSESDTLPRDSDWISNPLRDSARERRSSSSTSSASSDSSLSVLRPSPAPGPATEINIPDAINYLELESKRLLSSADQSSNRKAKLHEIIHDCKFLKTQTEYHGFADQLNKIEKTISDRINTDVDSIAHFSNGQVKIINVNEINATLKELFKTPELFKKTPSKQNMGLASETPSIATTTAFAGKARVCENNLSYRPFLSTKDNTAKVVTVDYLESKGRFVSEIHGKPSDFDKLSERDLAKLAAITVQNYFTATNDTSKPVILVGNLSPKLVRTIATYCAAEHLKYDIQVMNDHLRNFKPSEQTDIPKMRNIIKQDATLIFDRASVLITGKPAAESVRAQRVEDTLQKNRNQDGPERPHR